MLTTSVPWMWHSILIIILCKQITFLSSPALASNFPSEEKWQQVTVLFLVLMQLNSAKVKPEMNSVVDDNFP